MQLKFPLKEIQNWYLGYFKESRPEDLVREARIETVIAPEVRARGYFTKDELLELCYWKTPRSRSQVTKNPDDFVEAVTGAALSTQVERLRIEALTLLDGVSWPGASVLLHFGSKDPYPILDFRALWSLSVEQPPDYQFDFWWEYTQTCRQLAHQAGVTMRSLDRALWQYSKKNQPSKPHAKSH